MRFRITLSLLWVAMLGSFAAAAGFPHPYESDYLIKNFRLDDGETLAALRIHYQTLGQPHHDAQGRVTNAILILHSTSGSSRQFLNDHFAGVLFNPGQLLDPAKYFIIIPDAIGHGKSSKPSDGMRAHFPHYRYSDMVRTQHQLLVDHLKVDHLRIVMGMSMGCMHTWLWAEDYPSMMDGAVPLACLPVEIAGRNRMWRKTAYDAIVHDPQYAGGDYTQQPRGLVTAFQVLALVGSSPVERQKQFPTAAAADQFLDDASRLRPGEDANDLAYALDSSSGYDPHFKLSSITAPLLAINFQDDLINPPELGILETYIKQVPQGRMMIIPAGPNTHGHGTHTWAAIWQSRLQQFMKETAK